MGKAVRRVRGESQKKIIKTMESLTGRLSLWEIWQDFIIMSAISIANTIDPPFREDREQTYLERARKYSKQELDAFAEMLAEVVIALDNNPDQDFLGELFMSMELGNEWKGQFFTPYSVCKMMATITYGNDLQNEIEKQGWVSVNDPACGAGALLIAFANECRRPGKEINYQTSVLFVAQDIDYLAGMMCYIQMSLLGCPGYVVIADTLTKPSTSIDKRGLIPVPGSNVWYTPMYFRDVWHWRRIFVQLDEMIPEPAPRDDAEEPTPPENVVETIEVAGGQLALF